MEKKKPSLLAPQPKSNPRQIQEEKEDGSDLVDGFQVEQNPNDPIKLMKEACQRLVSYFRSRQIIERNPLQEHIILKNLFKDYFKSQKEEDELLTGDAELCYDSFYQKLENREEPAAEQILPALFFFNRTLHQQFELSDKIVIVKKTPKFKIPEPSCSLWRALVRGATAFINEYFLVKLEKSDQRLSIDGSNAAVSQNPTMYFKLALETIERVVGAMYCRIVKEVIPQ